MVQSHPRKGLDNMFCRGRNLTFNPNKGGVGRNPPIPTLTARHFVCDEVRSVKPSCNFHFWCLEQVKNITLEGCKKIFQKI